MAEDENVAADAELSPTVGVASGFPSPRIGGSLGRFVYTERDVLALRC